MEHFCSQSHYIRYDILVCFLRILKKKQTLVSISEKSVFNVDHLYQSLSPTKTFSSPIEVIGALVLFCCKGALVGATSFFTI